MTALIVYTTNSGATEIVSQVVEETLTQAGIQVTRKLVNQTQPDELSAVDLVVLGSPSWDFDGKEGWPHEDFLGFMEQMKTHTYEGKKFAVFGLGDSSYTVFCGAVDHLEELVKTVKGTLVVESLRIDGFYFNQQQHTDTAKTWSANLVKAISGS